jgi:hypothetical protein
MKNELVQLCLDASKGRIDMTNYSKGDTSEAIRQGFVDLMGTDKPDYRTFRNHKPEVFQILEEVLDQVIYDSILQTPFFNQFVEYRDLNLGDTNEFYVKDRTMLTISEIADGHLNLRRQKLDIGSSFGVKTKTYGAKVYADFLRFVSGRVDWNDLVSKIDQAMRLKMANDIYTNFVGALSYLPSTFNQSGTFDPIQLSNLIQHVQAENGWAPVVIAGTRNSLKKINGAYNGISGFFVNSDMSNQINQQGYLAQFEGIPMLEIPQVHEVNSYTFKLDADLPATSGRIYILPANEKPIKVVREGQSIIVDSTQTGMNMDMSMEHTFVTKLGIATIFNVMYGAYTIS